MKIKTFEFNPLGVNTYVISDDTKECVVVDAACYYPDEQALLLDYIFEHDLVVKKIINTHLHFDHIFGVHFLTKKLELPLMYHHDDAYLLEDVPEQLSLFGFPSTQQCYKPVEHEYLKEGDTISFGNSKLYVLHVPGHSPGSLAFYEEQMEIVISGDTLFHGGIGRTDLPGGSFRQLAKSIQTKLYRLPQEVVVYPGHGSSTTIGYEKWNNPFINVI